MIFAGFSFGAAVGTRVACSDPDVPAIISLGTPVAAEGRTYSFDFLKDCRKPKLFLSGDHDEFGPHEELERIVANAAEPKELVFVPGDHYFAGHLDEMRLTIESWLGELLPHASMTLVASPLAFRIESQTIRNPPSEVPRIRL